VGTTQQVLMEEPNPRGDGGLSGHTDRNEIVHVGWESGLRVGDGMVPIRITRAYKHSLVGEVDRTRPEGLPEGWRRRLPIAPSDQG
jgi:tRNA A37 methylthiotransferase MiaB